MNNNIEESVKNYYGKVLKTNRDLKTSACSIDLKASKKLKDLINSIHPEVNEKFYGCGLIIPEAIEGSHILDLGSGSGRDSFILASLAGKKGRVVGVDMTKEQIEIAQKHKKYHEELFDLEDKNLKFVHGKIENILDTSLQLNSFDLIVSNCVINLVPNKEKVLKDTYKLLKVGGEFYFSDIYSDRRIPEHLTNNELLYGECLSGALYWNDFSNLAKNAGFKDPRVVSVKPVDIMNKEVRNLVDPIKFYSITYRLFKIQDLEPDCEDYGQAVCYKGNLDGSPHSIKLDQEHTFPKGKFKEVCGNTYLMLNQSRMRKYFEFAVSWDTHHGIFQNCNSKTIVHELSYDNEPQKSGPEEKDPSISCC